MTLALDALFDGQRQKALGWLLLNPDCQVHVRDLARRTKTHAGSLHRELSRLASAGLVMRTVAGNQVRYQANKQSPIFSELASIFRKTRGMTSVIRDAIEPLQRSIEVAFIYGSMAKGTAHEHSDIDLFVIGDADFTALVLALHPCQEELGREINIGLYSRAEHRRKLSERDAFIREVIAQPKLFVLGSDDDFGQPCGDREADPNQT